MPGILSEYYGQDQYKGRTSQVVWDGRKYLVRLFQDGNLIEERNLQGHNERYAEDCAENYVMGIF